MPNILCIETAASVCSVALAIDNHVAAYREIKEGFKHSEKITVFIAEVLAEAELKINDLNAVAVSSGPGSYTGLRIGMSAAKGLCLAADLPLITIPTLEILTSNAIDEIKFADEDALFSPMIDARRMEVYCAIYDNRLNCVQPAAAIIVTEDYFYDLGKKNKIFYFGDGAEKCSEILSGNFIYHPGIFASAKFMSALANDKYDKNQFENTSLVEPFYLKEFQPGPKNPMQHHL